jgi:hypothetical protein
MSYIFTMASDQPHSDKNTAKKTEPFNLPKTKEGLAPPWVIWYRELVSSIGADDSLIISPLLPPEEDESYAYLVTITVDNNPLKAQALANILPEKVTFSGVIVQVRVIDEEKIYQAHCPPGGIYSIATEINIALEDNPLFDILYVQPFGANPRDLAIFPVFKNEVLTFYNDDIGQLCRSSAQVAYQVFAKILPEKLCDV